MELCSFLICARQSAHRCVKPKENKCQIRQSAQNAVTVTCTQVMKYPPAAGTRQTAFPT